MPKVATLCTIKIGLSILYTYSKTHNPLGCYHTRSVHVDNTQVKYFYMESMLL